MPQRELIFSDRISVIISWMTALALGAIHRFKYTSSMYKITAMSSSTFIKLLHTLSLLIWSSIFPDSLFPRLPSPVTCPVSFHLRHLCTFFPLILTHDPVRSWLCDLSVGPLHHCYEQETLSPPSPFPAQQKHGLLHLPSSLEQGLV